METLDRDALTLASAHRQLLAVRQQAEVLDVVAHLVGVQAQEPHEPYLGLFARIEDTRAAELAWLLTHRLVARTHAMRSTIHLVTAADAGWLRGLHAPMLRAAAGHILAQRRDATGDRIRLDVAALVEPISEVVDAVGQAGAPPRASEVAAAIAPTLPGAGIGPRDLSPVVPLLAPLVQVPPRGLWEQTGPAGYATYRQWFASGSASARSIAESASTGRTFDDGAHIRGSGSGSGAEPAPTDLAQRLVLRYLAAYGPAATADIRAFSGVTGLPAAVAALGETLTHYRDERGRTLLDLASCAVVPPDGPQTRGDLPVRFLPAFDNAVLGYADRTRIIDDEHRHLSVAGARFVLVAGRVAATWHAEGIGGFADRATVEVTPLRTPNRAERAAVREEGARVARFLGRRAGRVVFG